MPNITLIAAMSLNGVIGHDNDIPWKISEDMKHFKETTTGHVVIMGRKTFESMGSKPLPGRTNIIISSKDIVTSDSNCYVVSDIKPAMVLAKRLSANTKEIFVIGGGDIYRQTIDMSDKLVISHIHKPIKGSVRFPEIDLDVWKVAKIDHRLTGDIPFSIITYIR